jgi:hypothetical protein
MAPSHSKCIIPPTNTPGAKVADHPSSSKALIHANNELQNLSQQLLKANQREGQLHGTLKKIRANHSRSLAESSRLRTAIENQRFIVNHFTNQFSSGFSAAGIPSQRKAPFSTPPPANKSPARKNQCMNPYLKTKTTRKLDFDDAFADASQDAELAKVLQDAETSATATTNAKKTEGKSPGEEIANLENIKIKEGAKTSGETAADYTDLTVNRGSCDESVKPMDDGASM